jgi:putative NADPH-quinone reductase
MKCLLVLAHPLESSLNAALADAAAEELRKLGHELRIRNLYASQFQPALSAEERQTYYGAFDDSGIAAEALELLWAEVVILVFPTWWFGLPAILKGWFDRVWAPGIAYDHAADMGPIQPRLHQLRRTLAITTLGSPWWVDWLVMGRPVRKVLKRAVLGLCAPRAGFSMLSFYACEKKQLHEVAGMQQRVRSTVRRLVS